MGHSWYTGDTINLSFGHGFLTVTPLQMAIATTVMARKGAWIAPRLVNKIETQGQFELFDPAPLKEDIFLNNPKNWQLMNEAMQAVAHESRGTARNHVGKNLKYRIAAKTGTLQVISIKEDVKYDDIKDTLDRRQLDSAWLVAFAPADNPQIAIALHLENAGHGGSMATPIARNVFDEYLLDENGVLIHRYRSMTKPDSKKITDQL